MAGDRLAQDRQPRGGAVVERPPRTFAQGSRGQAAPDVMVEMAILRHTGPKAPQRQRGRVGEPVRGLPPGSGNAQVGLSRWGYASSAQRLCRRCVGGSDDDQARARTCKRVPLRHEQVVCRDDRVAADAKKRRQAARRGQREAIGQAAFDDRDAQATMQGLRQAAGTHARQRQFER